MNYTPISLPNDISYDVSSFEPALPVSMMEGLGANYMQAAAQLPTTVIGTALKRLYEEHFGSNWLSPEEAKQKYSNVSFPKGGYENYIKNISDSKTREQYWSNMIDSMPKGFLAASGKLGTVIAVNALDPLNIAVGTGLESSFGTFAAQWAARETNILPKLLVKASTGAIEGAVLTTPLAMSTAAYYEQLQMPMTEKNITGFIATNAVVGAGLRTLFGLKRIISSDDHTAALALAEKQALNGDKIDVSPVIKHATFRERSMDLDAEPEKIQQGIDFLNRRLEDTNKAIDETEKLYKEKTKTKGKANRFEINEDMRDTENLLTKLKVLDDAPVEFLEKEDKDFLNKLPNTNEFQAAMTYDRVPKENLTIVQQKFLDNFKKDELKVTQKGIDKNKTEIKRLNEKIKNKKTPLLYETYEEMAAKAEAKITELKKIIGNSQERIKELERIKKEPLAFKEMRQQYWDLKNDASLLQNHIIKDTQAYLDLVNKTGDPLEPAELKAAAAKAGTWQAKATSYMNDYYATMKKIQVEPISDDEFISYAKEEIQALKDTDKLDTEELTNVEDIEKMPQEEETINKKIKDFFDCMIRRMP